MDAKHTPGPWHAGGFGNTIIYAADGWAVADVKVYHDRHNGYEEMQANASLISAAPELLDALESFLRAPSVGSGGPGSSTIVVQEFNLRAARAAIAKAKGG